MPTGGEHIPGERFEAAGRQARIVQWRRERKTFPQIAAELGISRQRVQQIYEDAIRDVKEPTVHLHRQEMLEALELREQAALEVAARDHYVVAGKDGEVAFFNGDPVLDDGPLLAANAQLLRIYEIRAKLVGANAATKVEIESHVDPESIELMQLIKQREQSNWDERKQMIDNSGDPE